MRIMLFAAGGDIGGGKTHILSLTKELAKGNDLKLVSFRRGVLSQEAMEMGIDTVDTGGNNGVLACLSLDEWQHGRGSAWLEHDFPLIQLHTFCSGL